MGMIPELCIKKARTESSDEKQNVKSPLVSQPPDGGAGSYGIPNWGEPRSSLLPALHELERFFFAYRVWFNQKLPRPVITIQSGERGRALGWFSRKRWKQAQLGNLLPEINVCPEFLSDDIFQIAHTMIHEMVHYANARMEILDCNENQYHNGHFKARAEEVGLDCGLERHPRFAWGVTRLTDISRRRIETIGLNNEAFSLFRGSFILLPSGAKGQSKPKLLNWTCKCDSVWRASGRPPMMACCQKCGSLYKLESRRKPQ